MKVMPTPWIPESAVAIIQDDDDNDHQTASAKGVLRQPRGLAGLTLRIEFHSSAQKVADITNILANISHENIVKIHGMGDHFVVMDFWDETLKSRLRRWGVLWGDDDDYRDDRDCGQQNPQTTGKRHIWSRIHSTKKSKSIKDGPLDLWHDVALPVTRALLYLHQQHVALGGTLNMHSIVLAYNKGSKSSRPPKVLLRDFSRAIHASTVSEYFSDVFALLSDDVFQLGQLFTELERFQPLLSVDTRNDMGDLIGRCCDLNPLDRPSVRGVHERLTEILRYEMVWARSSSSWNLNRLVCPIGRLSCPVMTDYDNYNKGQVWVSIHSYSDLGHNSHDKVAGGISKPGVGRRYAPLKDDQIPTSPPALNLSITTASTSNASFFRCECAACRMAAVVPEVRLNPSTEELMNQLDALVQGVIHRSSVRNEIRVHI